jgi:hypothetical protein
MQKLHGSEHYIYIMSEKKVPEATHTHRINIISLVKCVT